MKVAIEVKDRKEAALLKTAMADHATKAFALVMGALLELPSDRWRRRVLEFVRDSMEEEGRLPPGEQDARD